MFFTNRTVKEAKLLAKGARKVIANRRDLMKAEQIEEIEGSIQTLQNAIRAGDREQMEAESKTLEEKCRAVLPKYKHPVIREYCEVLLVAFILAAGIRAYFLQPFKIPTGSMQPTLNGIIGYPQEDTGPAFPVKWFQKAVLGRSYMDIVAPEDLVVLERRLITQNFFFTRTDLITTAGTFSTPVPPETLKNYFGVFDRREYKKGEVIVRGYADTGDQVFVDKFSYHFVRPKLGDVFVFRTNNIRGIEDHYGSSQFYIKRIAGTPGDTLRIEPPLLFIDGEIPDVFGLDRVMSLEDGYRGYSNRSGNGARFMFLGTPSQTFTMPEEAYFALGDNSYNSLDSRSWGVVPQENVVGRGFLVYWPFTSHWGVIR